jgi:hypothetical protein
VPRWKPIPTALIAEFRFWQLRLGSLPSTIDHSCGSG